MGIFAFRRALKRKEEGEQSPSILTAPEENKHVCPDCGKECNGAFGLQAHMRSHK